MREFADEAIRCELDEGERVLWSGQPRQGFTLRVVDAILVPFSLVWAGVAIVWEVFAIAVGAPLGMVLFGLPFVLIGLYLTVGRFWIDAAGRARTYYGLTERRAIIVSGLFWRTVRNFELADLTGVSLSERRNGRGTVTFGIAGQWPWVWGAWGWQGTGTLSGPSFGPIEGAREVYDMVRRARSAAREHAGRGDSDGGTARD